MKTFHPDEPPEIPLELFCCPKCGAQLIIEDIDEWEEGGRVTESGFHIDCSTAPDMDSDEWSEWFNWHWSMPYVDWLPLQVEVFGWFDENFRIEPYFA